MEWNVYLSEFNSKSIKTFNVFNHFSFNQDVNELKKKNFNKKDFSRELRLLAQYYFWSKYEYEVIITSWPPYISDFELGQIVYNYNNNKGRMRHHVNLEVGERIDVFSQLCLNWDAFVNYVYNWEEQDLDDQKS